MLTPLLMESSPKQEDARSSGTARGSLHGFAVVSVHFGRSGWTECLVAKLLCAARHTPGELGQILIVDNSRDGWIEDRLKGVPLVSVVSFPRDEAQFTVYGHDHAASLTRALLLVEGHDVIIFDCDAHPVREDFLGQVRQTFQGFSAITAPLMDDPWRSHPCYMAFRACCNPHLLTFDSSVMHGSVRCGEDVGRTIWRELTDLGHKVHRPRWTRAFGGVWGDLFDGLVYHHGCGTFRFSEVHRSMVHEYSSFFERIVLNEHRYHRSAGDRITLAVRDRIRRLRKLLAPSLGSGAASGEGAR